MNSHTSPSSPRSTSAELTISCSELRRRLGRYLVLVQTEGAVITVARYGRPAAVLGQIDAAKGAASGTSEAAHAQRAGPG